MDYSVRGAQRGNLLWHFLPNHHTCLTYCWRHACLSAYNSVCMYCTYILSSVPATCRSERVSATPIFKSCARPCTLVVYLVVLPPELILPGGGYNGCGARWRLLGYLELAALRGEENVRVREGPDLLQFVKGNVL